MLGCQATGASEGWEPSSYTFALLRRCVPNMPLLLVGPCCLPDPGPGHFRSSEQTPINTPILSPASAPPSPRLRRQCGLLSLYPQTYNIGGFTILRRLHLAVAIAQQGLLPRNRSLRKRSVGRTAARARLCPPRTEMHRRLWALLARTRAISGNRRCDNITTYRFNQTPHAPHPSVRGIHK